MHCNSNGALQIYSRTRLNIHPCLYDAYGMTVVEAASQGEHLSKTSDSVALPVMHQLLLSRPAAPRFSSDGLLDSAQSSLCILATAMLEVKDCAAIFHTLHECCTSKLLDCKRTLFPALSAVFS